MDTGTLSAQLEQHHALSYGWALTCCARHHAEAEDVLQAAYLKILDGRARFDGRASFKTWLFAIIRTTAADERRRHWLRLTRLGDYLRERAENGHSADREAGSEHEERTQAFRVALARLPRRQREVLHLVFYQGLTIEEAAAVMAVGVGSARTHYERGKQRLREWLKQSRHLHEDERNGQQLPAALP